MTELNEKSILAIYKIQNAIKDTGFFLNRFSVTNSGIDKLVIEFDIRE